MRKSYILINPISRLWKYSKVVDGHWLWFGRTSKNGYGIIKYLRHQISTHRLSAHLHLGLDLKSPLMSLHKVTCQFKNCWNPDCLYVGTHTDNMNDIKSLNKCPRCGDDYDTIVHLYGEGRIIRRCRECHNKAQRIRNKAKRRNK